MDRLKQWSEFQAVMSQGIVARTPHFALHQWQFSNTSAPDRDLGAGPALFKDGHLLLGALTPKRWAKRAVTRNLIRRQIYALSQTLMQELPPTAYVVRLRAALNPTLLISASSPSLKRVVREELQQLFCQMGSA